MKTAYIDGPLTELEESQKKVVKSFYARIADVCGNVFGVRAFVPHEHFDPERHSKFTPQEVDVAERDQVCNKTSVLIVVAVAPSWGGGIEVEMAWQSKVPALVLCESKKLRTGKISRLLRGNPAVQRVIEYETDEEALYLLRGALLDMQRLGIIE